MSRRLFYHLFFLLLMPLSFADNITTINQNNNFDSNVLVIISNSTISLTFENGTIIYPNVAGFNYTYSFQITRSVNVTNYYFSTVPLGSNITCPSFPSVTYNLSCPSVNISETELISNIRGFYNDNIKPSQDELDDCNTNKQRCIDDKIELQGNISEINSKVGEYRANANNYKELYDTAKAEKMPYVILIVILLGLCLFMVAMFSTGGNIENLFRRKPF